LPFSTVSPLWNKNPSSYPLFNIAPQALSNLPYRQSLKFGIYGQTLGSGLWVGSGGKQIRLLVSAVRVAKREERRDVKDEFEMG
jgi:hypothetical protein